MNIGEVKEAYNRGSEIRYLKKISKNEYLIYGHSEWIRSGFYDKNIKFVDFEMGPFLIEKDNLRYWGEDDLIIKSITKTDMENPSLVAVKITIQE